MKYKATIKFRVMRSHPDYDCIKVEDRDKQLEYTDVYTFDPDYGYTSEDAKRYMKKDLALVAGGGYNADHIYKVSYIFERVG